MDSLSSFTNEVRDLIIMDVESEDYQDELLEKATDKDLSIALKMLMATSRSRGYELVRKELIRKEQRKRRRKERIEQERKAKQKENHIVITKRKDDKVPKEFWDEWRQVTAELRVLLGNKGKKSGRR